MVTTIWNKEFRCKQSFSEEPDIKKTIKALLNDTEALNVE